MKTIISDDRLFSVQLMFTRVHCCVVLSKVPFNLCQYLIKHSIPTSVAQMALLCASGCISLYLQRAAQYIVVQLQCCASAVVVKEAVTAIMYHTLIWQTQHCRVGLCLCLYVCVCVSGRVGWVGKYVW